MLLCCLYHVAYAIHIYSTPDRRAQYCNERVCLSVCVCLSTNISSDYTSDFHNFLCMLPMAVARSSSGGELIDILCTSGFMDDVIFAHKPRLLDVAAQLKLSAHAALGLAINCAQ